jgi:hypothetical protein
MKVKLIGGGPMTGRVLQIPDDRTPEVLVNEPDMNFFKNYPVLPDAPAFRTGRYASLQPGINGGPKRLVWQGYS